MSVTIVPSVIIHVKKFVAFWRRHNVDQHLFGQLQSETHRPWRHVQRHGDTTTTSSGLLTDKVALLVDTPSASMLVVTSRLNSHIILWVWRSFWRTELSLNIDVVYGVVVLGNIGVDWRTFALGETLLHWNQLPLLHDAMPSRPLSLDFGCQIDNAVVIA